MTRIHTDHNGVYVNAISGMSDGTNVEGHVYDVHAGRYSLRLSFQLGPIKEAGVNGLTNEALIAVLTHRMKVLNSKFPCAENQRAINHLELAAQALESRTKDRIARGVEGTHAT